MSHADFFPDARTALILAAVSVVLALFTDGFIQAASPSAPSGILVETAAHVPARWYAAAVGLCFFVMGLGMHLALRQTYGRLLRRLRRGLSDLAEGHRPEPLPEAEPGVQAINGLLERMAETHASLQAHEERYRAMIEYTSDLILILDQRLQVVFASPSCEGLLGLPPEAVVGKPALSFLHLEDRHSIHRAILNGRKNPSAVTSAEARFRHRNGTWRYIAFKARNLIDQPGINGILINAHDITEAKRSEHELVVVKNQAEEMVRLKSAFLTNMSHEIRTPLTGILGFAQILRSEVGEPYRDLVTSIEQSGQRLLNTLNSVLDLAQLESESVRLKMAELNVFEEVLGTVQMLKPLADMKGLVLDIETVSEFLIARLDRVYLHRIINNLVGNAIKFTEAGGVTVHLEVEADQLHIKVRDTGVGIDVDFMPHLFSEFKQESTGLGREYEGNGLGLTITRRLVELMQGRITVESTKGLGSVFCVTFPYEPSLQPPPFDQGAPQRPAVPLRGPRRSILAVEDNPDSRKLIHRWLHTACALTTVASGEEALALTETERFDAVLMDISLGGALDGVAVMREMRARPGFVHTRFIALTAYALPGDRERFLLDGFDDYLSKPFRQEELLDVLRRTLRKPAARPLRPTS